MAQQGKGRIDKHNIQKQSRVIHKDESSYNNSDVKDNNSQMIMQRESKPGNPNASKGLGYETKVTTMLSKYIE